MRSWDSSALIALLIDEPVHEALMVRLDEDPQLLVWWGTSVEIVSALARRELEGSVSPTDLERAYSSVRLLSRAWREMLPSKFLRRTAERLVRMHPLRASDSLQPIVDPPCDAGQSRPVQSIAVAQPFGRHDADLRGDAPSVHGLYGGGADADSRAGDHSAPADRLLERAGLPGMEPAEETCGDHRHGRVERRGLPGARLSPRPGLHSVRAAADLDARGG